MVRIPAFQAGCVGSIPITRSTSSRTAYRSRRLFLLKSHLSLIPSLLLSAKGHAPLTCSVASALTTVHCRCQPFAGKRVQLPNLKLLYIFIVHNINISRVSGFFFCAIYFFLVFLFSLKTSDFSRKNKREQIREAVALLTKIII